MSKLDRQAVTLDWLEEFRARVDEPISGRRKVPWDFFPEHWTKDDRYYERDHWTEGDIMTAEVKDVYEETCQGLDALLESYGYVREGRYYRAERHNDDTIVLFCHMGIIAAMMCHLTGIPMPLLMHGFFLAPTSVSIVQTEERKDDVAYFRCQVFGDTQHLHDANEPISSSGYYAEAFQG
ncbi:histidine phosphatase family protein [Coprococcus sp. AF21-14LB]|uniref:histidine phosphatase family protein n=1 Tax=Coprococcus sp. AF21-14LB TaxID=2292231 RepID=UPI001FA848C9|nr:histidine phosphatase family protein [Coprococcus sp. AF21-14LB]